MQATGRLSGRKLIGAGGNPYRAGDHVIALRPGADGRLVTSQRAVVAAIDATEATLILRTEGGQHVQLGAEEAGSDRLGYGYATSVHRGQGSTIERAHLFALGGGRELAYVAMSRARQSTHVWTVADDLPQAADDLRRDWSTRRTPGWAIDAALPDPATLTRELFHALPSDQQARLAALFQVETAIAGDAIIGIGLPDRAAALGQAKPLWPKPAKPVLKLKQAGAAGRPPRRVGRSRTSPTPARPATSPVGGRSWIPLVAPPRGPKRSREMDRTGGRRSTALGSPRRSHAHRPRPGDCPPASDPRRRRQPFQASAARNPSGH